MRVNEYLHQRLSIKLSLFPTYKKCGCCSDGESKKPDCVENQVRCVETQMSAINQLEARFVCMLIE